MMVMRVADSVLQIGHALEHLLHRLGRLAAYHLLNQKGFGPQSVLDVRELAGLNSPRDDPAQNDERYQDQKSRSAEQLPKHARTPHDHAFFALRM